MKIFKTSRFAVQIILLLFAVSITSCVVQTGTTHTVKTKQIPPGQAKKMSGQKSAKNYAPGQNK
jgi:hypothetical protein